MLRNCLAFFRISFKTFFIFLLLANNSFANNGHFYFIGSGGYSNLMIDKTDPTIKYYGGGISDGYPSTSRDFSAAIFGVGGGYELCPYDNAPAIAFGISAYGNPENVTVHGTLAETTLGGTSTTLYNYRYNFRSFRVMAEVQATWDIHNLLPFVNVGIGPSYNRFSNYQETSVDVIGYPPLPPFQNKNNSSFAYQLGLGVAYAFNWANEPEQFLSERVSFGYRYVNLGSAQSGNRSTTYPFSLRLGKATTNEFYVAYTHLL